MSTVDGSMAPTSNADVSASPRRPRRRRTVATVIGSVALVAIAAVGVALALRPGGAAESSPTTPPEDRTVVPPIGSCHVGDPGKWSLNEGAETERRVSCDEPHDLQTIASGIAEAFEHAPNILDPGTVPLYGRCEEAANKLTGANWRDTYTYVVLSVPSASAWQKGAHWYRCDIGRTEDVYGTIVRAPGQLTRDAVRPITCLNFTVSQLGIENITDAPCTGPHSGEWAGPYTLPFAARNTAVAVVRQMASDACHDQAMTFLGANRIPTELTWWGLNPTFALGSKYACVVGPLDANRKLGASLKGIGNGAIPFV